jgi:hypothetical protein
MFKRWQLTARIEGFKDERIDQPALDAPMTPMIESEFRHFHRTLSPEASVSVRNSSLRSKLASISITLCIFTAPAAAQTGTVEQLSWLAGCWELRTPARVVEEYWMRPRAGTMLGMGRTVVRDSMTEYESTMIRVSNGKLAYHANPSGQKPNTFSAIAITADSVVFEDPAHDFPQRVGYTRHGADSLVAWIEGTSNGRTRRIPFPYKRVSCSG